MTLCIIHSCHSPGEERTESEKEMERGGGIKRGWGREGWRDREDEREGEERKKEMEREIQGGEREKDMKRGEREKL